jgi:GNAT superfamily N-acetyltransferase
MARHRAESPVVSTIRYRVAGPADVPEVVALVESAYRGDASRAGWTTEAHLLGGQRTDADAVHEVMARPDSWVLLAELDGELDGELVGCCHLERTDDQTAYFGLFSVRPGLQGHGLGRALLGEAERRAVGFGAIRMRMTVIRQRPDLIAWYERLGYARTGATSPFPYGDERYGIPKVDDLEFVELVKGW